MVLAYQADIDVLKEQGIQCPPADATPVTKTAWRWVFNPISEACICPQAVRNPRRLIQAKDVETKCSCWALSMHESLKASISAFQAVERMFPRARKILGNHIATVNILPEHGLCTSIDCNGHFDFHPYATADVAGILTLQQVIP